MPALTITEHHGATIRTLTVDVDELSQGLELARLLLGYAPTNPIQGTGIYRTARAGGKLEVEISDSTPAR